MRVKEPKEAETKTVGRGKANWYEAEKVTSEPIGMGTEMYEPTDDAEFCLQAQNEVENGPQSKALWAKVMTLCEGDSDKAKYRYIRTRVEELKRELQLKTEAEAVDRAKAEAEAKLIVGSGLNPGVYQKFCGVKISIRPDHGVTVLSTPDLGKNAKEPYPDFSSFWQEYEPLIQDVANLRLAE